jgi:hypothetical protein
LLVCLGLTVVALALLHFSNTWTTVESWPAALTGGLLIGWLIGYLGQGIINFLGSTGAWLTALVRVGPTAMLSALAAPWPAGAALAEAVNHWTVFLLIGFGLWVLVSRRLYLGGGRSITGWVAGVLGLLMLVMALLRSATLPYTDMGAYLVSRCFGPDLVAYLASLCLIGGALLAGHAPVDSARQSPGRLLRIDGVFTGAGLAAGCLLGLTLKDPMLLSGATPWLAVRLGLTALALTALPLVALAKASPAQGTVSLVRVLAGGLFLGLMVGYLSGGIVSAVWPIDLASRVVGG